MAGSDGFWLAGEGKLIFINAKNGQATELTSGIGELPVGGPLEACGRIILCFKKSLLAFDSKTGQPVWVFELPGEAVGSVAVGKKNILVALISGLIIGLDSESGRNYVVYLRKKLPAFLPTGRRNFSWSLLLAVWSVLAGKR